MADALLLQPGKVQGHVAIFANVHAADVRLGGAQLLHECLALLKDERQLLDALAFRHDMA